MRTEAETHLKAELKNRTKTDQEREYKPVNYYGRFIKEKIEAAQAQADSHRLKINAQFFRELFWGAWMALSDDAKATYRS